MSWSQWLLQVFRCLPQGCHEERWWENDIWVQPPHLSKMENDWENSCFVVCSCRLLPGLCREQVPEELAPPSSLRGLPGGEDAGRSGPAASLHPCQGERWVQTFSSTPPAKGQSGSQGGSVIPHLEHRGSSQDLMWGGPHALGEVSWSLCTRNVCTAGWRGGLGSPATQFGLYASVSGKLCNLYISFQRWFPFSPSFTTSDIQLSGQVEWVVTRTSLYTCHCAQIIIL